MGKAQETKGKPKKALSFFAGFIVSGVVYTVLKPALGLLAIVVLAIFNIGSGADEAVVALVQLVLVVAVIYIWVWVYRYGIKKW